MYVEKSKIRQKFCVCNLFFAVVWAIVAVSSVFWAKSQPVSETLPFFQSSSGASQPASLLLPTNPALLANVEKWAVSAAFSPSPFGISELGFAECMAARRISERWVAGAGAAGYGSAKFNEFHGVLLSAVRIGEQLSLGASAEYTQISVRSFGSQRGVQLHLGMRLFLDSSVIAAASVSNVLRSGFGDSPVIRQQFRFGVGILASEFWAFDADVVIGEVAWAELGAMFAPVRGVKLRLGYSTGRDAVELFPAVAVGDDAQIFSRIQWSNELGFSQQVGVNWKW